MTEDNRLEAHECFENICNIEFLKHVLMVVTGATRLLNGDKTGVWFEEFAIPYMAFLDAGYKVTVATPLGDAAPIDPASESVLNDVKWRFAKQALNAPVKIDTVDVSIYDALILPGGHGPMIDLAKNEVLGHIINRFDEENKLIGAICHGPAGLLSAVKNGIPFVNGKRMTAFSNEEENLAKKEAAIPFYLEDALKIAGADFVKDAPGVINVVEHGNLVTAQNYQSTKLFSETIVKKLSAR